MANIGGMQMLLKSFGVDPAQIVEAAQQIPEKLNAISSLFERVEKKLDRVLEILEGEVIDMPDDEISIREPGEKKIQ